MDQTFNFRAAPVPLLRRAKPRSVALAVAAILVVCGLVSFSRWIIDSERRSLARADRAAAATSMVGTIPGDESAVDAADIAIDEPARSDVLAALEGARRAASGAATFLDAGPGQLGATASRLIFVDGPSQGPGVVSVASTPDAWGAAVMGGSGTCYLLRYASGSVSFGIGRACTGDEALEAHDPTW